MRAKDFTVEADTYQPPKLSVGDRIFKGKFKNSPAEIKGFTKDKHNQPVLKTNKGEVQLFKPRVAKLMDKDVAEDREYIPSGKKRITRHGIDLVVSIDGATVDIRAMTGDSQMAYVVFDRDGDTLVADDLAVEEQYKGQGIAKIMYDYVKELGFRVNRSSDQLVAGKKFWDKNKGAENNIWEQGVAEGTEKVNPLTNAVISFYKPVVDQIEPGAVDNYVKQAKELLNQAPDPTIRSRMLEIFRKGQKDPMIQGGVITAIAAILTGGLLSSASRMGLSPAQTNILLQAVLNTVIPTIIARINNKSWRDTIKYTLASVGVGMTAAATLSEKRVTEGLSIDVPNEQWLQDKIDYAKSKGRDEWGAPFFGSTTAYARPNPQVSVVRLELLKGMRNEQNNVRKPDLEWLMAHMEKTGKLPLTNQGEEYAPFVMVAYNGEAWVNEGNHRIMAAFRLGWKKMPVEIKYFDGGERVQDGIMYPGKIGLK